MQQWWIQHINFTKQFKTSCIQINLQCSIYLHWSVGQHRVALMGQHGEATQGHSLLRLLLLLAAEHRDASNVRASLKRPRFLLPSPATRIASLPNHSLAFFWKWLLNLKGDNSITNLQRAINLRQRSVNLLFSPPCICSKLKYLFTEGSITLDICFYIYFFFLRRRWKKKYFSPPPCICRKLKCLFTENSHRMTGRSMHLQQRNISAEGGKQEEKQKERSWKCQLVFAWHCIGDIWNSMG